MSSVGGHYDTMIADALFAVGFLLLDDTLPTYCHPNEITNGWKISRWQQYFV